MIDVAMCETVGGLGQQQARHIIAADVGGTHARMGLVHLNDSGVPQLVLHRCYSSVDFSSLAAVLCQFRFDMQTEGQVCPDEAVIAIAGMLQGDVLHNANLPWSVTLATTEHEAGLRCLYLVNDFEALAWALPHIDPQQRQPLNTKNVKSIQFPALLLGPGTGLGAALVVQGQHGLEVWPSEVGQAALSASSDVELSLLQQLKKRFGHVENERVLSGTGLMNLYGALCELRGAVSTFSTPAQVLAAANAGDALANECLAVFCAWLGSLAGDLTLIFRAKTVFLAGGLTGHLSQNLQSSEFMRRFCEKGVLSHMLRQVEVVCVAHGTLGIIGAAAWLAAADPSYSNAARL